MGGRIMFVFEIIANRLRAEGWEVQDREARGGRHARYEVILKREGIACRVSGPTLLDAFAQAARLARGI